MTVSAIPREGERRHHRRLATVEELAAQYRQPKTTLYDFLRRTPEAGVLRIGRRIMVDVDEFDEFVRRHPGGQM